jgi:TonB family protein
LGVIRLDHQGQATEASPELAKSPFAEHARAVLNADTDPRTSLAAFSTITEAGTALNNANRLPAGFTDLCESVRRKVIAIKADATCDLPLPHPEPAEIQQSRLVFQMPPTYPRGAKMLGRQGSVHQRATIGTKGEIVDLELIGGPLDFYDSARSAVLKWKYTPTKVNGVPMPVTTQIDINYELH